MIIKILGGIFSGLILEISGIFLLYLGLKGEGKFSMGTTFFDIELTTTHIGLLVVLFGVILQIFTIRKKFKTKINESITVNSDDVSDNTNLFSENIKKYLGSNPIEMLSDSRYENLSTEDKTYFERYLKKEIISSFTAGKLNTFDIEKCLDEFINNKEMIKRLLSTSIKYSYTHNSQLDGGAMSRYRPR